MRLYTGPARRYNSPVDLITVAVLSINFWLLDRGIVRLAASSGDRPLSIERSADFRLFLPVSAPRWLHNYALTGF